LRFFTRFGSRLGFLVAAIHSLQFHVERELRRFMAKHFRSWAWDLKGTVTV
jgi:hypothetical protein